MCCAFYAQLHNSRLKLCILNAKYENSKWYAFILKGFANFLFICVLLCKKQQFPSPFVFEYSTYRLYFYNQVVVTFHIKMASFKEEIISIDLNMQNTRKQFLPIPLDWMGKKLILCHLYFKEKSLPKAFLVPSLHQSLPLHNRSVTLTLHLRQRKAKKL